MGCKHSAPVEQKPLQKMMDRPQTMSPPVIQSTYDISPDELMRIDVDSIIHCVKKVPMPESSSPVSCLTETSCPIILAPFHYKDEFENDAQFILPILGISRIEFGRVLCFGSFEILSLCDENDSDYVLFLEKMMRWVGGPSPDQRNVLVSNHLGHLQDGILYNLRELGFGFEVMTDDMKINFPKYSFLILESSFSKTDGIYEYIMGGGGLICGASPAGTKNRFNMNSVLSKVGIGFPNASFELITDSTSNSNNSHNFFQLPFNFDDLWRQTLPTMVQNAEKLFASKKNFDTQKIDSILTLLRYDIALLNVGQCPELANLNDSAISYLQTTDYEQDGTICADETQAIIALAATESFLKMTPHELSQFDVGSLFPGISNQFLDEKTIRVCIRDNKWHSVGLWLPAGVVSFISFMKFSENIIIQIGSHPDFIVDKRGPWKRWPSIVLTYEVTKPQIEISSPYGGMVYFLTKEKNLKKPIKFSANFTDICKCPQYNIKKPKKWEKTVDNMVPWSEILCAYIIFTVPSHIARNSPSLDSFTQFVDEMIIHIKDFLVIALDEYHFRLIFDVELPKEGFICGYPIVMDLATAPIIFGPITPSKELFLLFVLIAITALPENLFTHKLEFAIATMATAFSFKKKWPKCQPLTYSDKMNEPLVKELYQVYDSKGVTVFQDTNCEVQENISKLGQMSQSEASLFYLNLISKSAKEDYKFTLGLENSDSLSNSAFVLHSQSDES